MRSARAVSILSGALVVGALGLSSTALGAASTTHTQGGGTAHIAGMSSRPAKLADSLIKVINWSGRSWYVYSSTSKGPENVELTNAPGAAYVDGAGRLHLTIMKVQGQWRSVELRTVSTVTYGTFRLINDTATARFSNRTVFGMFIYRPGASKSHGKGNEIDVENSRFPNYLKAPNNAQFAVQPYTAPHHEHAYHVTRSDVPLRQQLTWYPPSRGKGTVKFSTRVGATSHSPLLSHWSYQGSSDPTNQNMYVFITLWLNRGKPPTHGTHSVILRSLSVTPLR
jgi:hypothetical protein